MTINDSKAEKPLRATRGKDDAAKAKKPPQHDPIAVVGMGCRLPGESSSPHALWKFLERGGIAKNEPPASRFSLKTHYDGSGKPCTMGSPGGMFLENVDPENFDAAFFSISSTEAIAMDPQQRQLLEVVYECLENAGISLESLSGAAVACLVGSYAGDYETMQSRDPEDRAPSVTVGIGKAMLSNRISHFLNIKGPSMTIDTACSGGLVSLDVACRYLQSREVDGAIIAAANLYLNPEHCMDRGAMKAAASISGKCHTFDVKADGYIKGEAVNAVMLKRLDDAIRDGDPIRAVIRGTATNSDGYTPGIASPSSEAQAAAVRAAYANAGISDLSETAYVECHGTGTQAGDPTEVSGVSSVFANGRSEPLIIGSIKSNVGHSEPAAGLSGLIKAILALEHDTIPGNPTFVDPNPAINFDKLQVRASRTALPWPKKLFKRASVNSFGYGGSNAHVVLDEARKWSALPQVSSYQTAGQLDDFFGSEEKQAANHPPRLLVFSANDESSLRSNASALSKHLMNPEVSVKLDDLAYTLSERRTRHFNRGFLLSRSPSSIDDSTLTVGKRWAEAPRIGFVFTGQGAQWSQMGKALVDQFPRAKLMIQRLDKALRTVPNPPKWSLLTELVEARNPQVLRQPEFSQPLVTALQLALVDVLRSFGVNPQAVVGHSSGEIAAACTAGYLTEENAIKAAFYRGQAAVQAESQGTESDVSMLAVGLGPNDVAGYLAGFEDQAQIACFNSPNSVTISGAVPALNQVKDLLVQDGHFARMLQVNLAYHSRYMDGIGKVYEDMLERDFECNPIPEAGPKMFSSVLGYEMDQAASVGYWKANMVSPVLFDKALEQMITGDGAADFLIEIGPSKALAGPVSQIKSAVPGGANVEYCGALSRGADAIDSLFDAAGRLFVAGANVDLMAVNRLTSTKPSIIIDLPNYSWNHSIKYWYENESSKDWRYRMFPHHDLVGTKILGTSWHSPSWKKSLSLADLPWLKDHTIGGEILFPAAGFMAMAIEGVHQVSLALAEIDDVPAPTNPCYRVRDSTFPKALVLDETKPTKLLLSLARRPGKNDPWYEYKVSSLSGTTWVEHCRGLVRVEENRTKNASTEDLQPLKHVAPGQLWYKALDFAGFQFGPSFQKHLEVESISGQRRNRSIVDLTTPPSAWTQSSYPMHPASIDGCLQTVVPAVWQGNRSAVDTALIPAIIDEILVCPPKTSSPETGISLASSKYTGLGRLDDNKNYMADARVYHPTTGEMLFQLKGLRFHKLDNNSNTEEGHKFARLEWKPDLTYLNHNDPMFQKFTTSEFMDHVAFKMPNLNIAEINLLSGNESSLWIDAGSGGRSTASKFTYFSSDAKALVTVQDKYSSIPSTDFQLFDTAKPGVATKELIEYTLSLLHADGYIYLIERDITDQTQTKELLQTFGFGPSHPLPETNAYLIATAPLKWRLDRNINMVRFRPRSQIHDQMTQELERLGWTATDFPITATSQISGPVIVVDELETPLLADIDGEQWGALKTLLDSGSPILWVTEGSQMDVTRPTNAMIHGLARSVRGEDPSVNFATLDLEPGTTGPRVFNTLQPSLFKLQQEKPMTGAPPDFEYAVRDGFVYVSRIFPNDVVNDVVNEESHGRELQDVSLHGHPGTVRLRAERVGALDALSYYEVTEKEEEVPEGYVEVEIHAAGVNFKDLAIIMGTVPENEWVLGHEGAGVVRRSSSPSYKPGDRVIAFCKRTFGNRVITEAGRLHSMPDWMTFEEAASIPSVYLVSVYSLFDLADVQPGQRVLVHSAAGGVGIACIQLCQHIGAELFVTVGNDEKRKFLRDEYGIPDSHIFHSRTTRFAAELMEATNDEGVDVVINTLTGELLEESWRCIREGGTFVELGKKDIVDRNYLPMEPFARNVSYHAFDMGHRRVPADFVDRLFNKLMPLVEERIVKPITPMSVFPFEDIPAALHYMRGGKHVGKLVISNNSSPDVTVKMRPKPRVLQLRGDASYLLVGGLKGLCGSLAVQLARRGAKHLVILARSGYADAASQAAIAHIESEGCQVQLMVGDVSKLEDVRRVFAEATPKIAGVIQGAMVLRDKIFTSMTIDEYHQAVDCKVKGTWNLHNVALEAGQELDFFSMLSSISGVVGQRGQANYAAANAFLDAFAAYRRGLGLRANSIDLGAVEEVGYISRNTELLQNFDAHTWFPINESLFLRIVEQSILQQVRPDYPASDCQLITGLAVPLGAESALLADGRFCTLRIGGAGQDAGAANGKDKEMATFLLLARSGSDPAAALAAAVDIVNKQFQKVLRLPVPVEPAKALSSYGLDSLVAVELRNWIRRELSADLTTLDITNAKSLLALCEKIVRKVEAKESS
ncbi:Type I Iterative PKS [Diplodia intermedia]|uniref:Type I Iterative PKS n=1 Tax=Diplodia intermedia TaxID=856260 RepID=A0ABR3TRS5_9PEZI